MKSNVIIFLLATLLISTVSVIAMFRNLDSSNPVVNQCRIQSDIKPDNFNIQSEPELTDKSNTCGIFGDIKPKDWDEWFEDTQTSNG